MSDSDHVERLNAECEWCNHYRDEEKMKEAVKNFLGRNRSGWRHECERSGCDLGEERCN